jgi:imidazolonepropionase-like amidohydrolase
VNSVIPLATTQNRVWLRVGTLLDGTSKEPLRNAHVVYDAEKILYAGIALPPETLTGGLRAPDADLPEQTLLPGLIEAHAHLFLEGGELNLERRAVYLKKSREELFEAARGRLEKLVRLGVAAVRDAGDKDGVGLALSKLYRSRERPLMPYLDSPGAAIHHKGRYGTFMAEPMEDFASPSACVAARIAAGADRIKLIPTGIINFQKGAVTTEPQMTTEEIVEMVRTARAAGKQSFAHASGDGGIQRAINGGVDSVEHGFFIRDDQLAQLRDKQIGWVPTFAPVQEQVDHADLFGWSDIVVSNLKHILEQHAASLVRGASMGVTIIAGSDAGSCGVAHGVGFLYELELMEQAGLSPLAVINSATGASAGRLEFHEKFGQITPGFKSRFILTRHSPLKTVANLRRKKTVVFDGAVIESGDDPDVSGL